MLEGIMELVVRVVAAAFPDAEDLIRDVGLVMMLLLLGTIKLHRLTLVCGGNTIGIVLTGEVLLEFS